MSDFAGKTVLVTGAASGIGEGIARRFHDEGATVVGSDINEARLAEVADEFGDRFIPVVSNAGKVADIEALIGMIDSDYGVLDVLVNNAGIGLTRSVEDITEEDYDLTMDIMIKGPVFFVKYAAPLLRKSDNGSVINISSVGGIMTFPNYCPYALTKAAIIKLTEDSVVQARGIRHNAILPGAIDTPILVKGYGEEGAEAMLGAASALCSPGRPGYPKDIANAALFLASEEASYVNGASLVVDGGLSRLTPFTQ